MQASALRDHFLGWQCRLRQIAMRQDGGRPSRGMQPRVLLPGSRELSPALTVLLVPKAPAESTAFFRFQVLRSNDPRDVYDRGLAYLKAGHFQQPQTFSDRLTAVLGEDSAVGSTLARAGACVLEFDQFRQRYRLPAAAAVLAMDDPAREASIWHNRIFNPALPDRVMVLAFAPDWERAEADPPPPLRTSDRPR